MNTYSENIANPNISNLVYAEPKRRLWDFEFMDLEFIPNSLRSALRDILQVGNAKPFRNYYQWAAKSVYEYATKHGINEVTELGAGCAPITRTLSKQYPDWQAKFNITDINPDKLNYEELSRKDGRIHGVLEPVDFSKPNTNFKNSVLVLSATFHHIPEHKKDLVLENLKKLSPHVIVLEPLRPNFISLLFVVCALISGFLAPLFLLNSKKFFRSALWCWLIPIAPFFFLWDGWVSSIRCWSAKEWREHVPQVHIEESLFCCKAIIEK